MGRSGKPQLLFKEAEIFGTPIGLSIRDYLIQDPTDNRLMQQSLVLMLPPSLTSYYQIKRCNIKARPFVTIIYFKSTAVSLLGI